MKTIKWISLAMLVLGLCSAQVHAQDCDAGIGISISADFTGTTTEASSAHEGASVDYDVTYSLNPTDCQVINAVITIYYFDGTWAVIASGVTINPGDTVTIPNVGPILIDADYLGDYDEPSLPGAPPLNAVTTSVTIIGTAITNEGTQGVAGAADWSITVVSNPHTTVTIGVDPDTGPIGFPAMLTVTEENTGEDPLTDVHVDVYQDTGGGEVPLVSLDYTTAGESGTDNDILDVAETWTWTYGPVNVLVPTTYVAYGFGTDPLGNVVTWCEDVGNPPADPPTICDQLERAEDDATPECPEPCIEITKSVDCDVSKVDDTVTYMICIENCGDYDLTGIEVTDDMLGDISDDFPDTLTPGQQVCEYFPYIIDEGDAPGPVENQAHVSATDSCDGETEVTDDSEIVTVTIVEACLDVQVDCASDGPVVPGEDATFTVTLTNCGDLALVVDVTTDLGICETDGTPVILAPAGEEGDTASCTSPYPVPVDFMETEICLEVTADWDLVDDLEGCLPNDGTVIETGCCEVGGMEGCTPGYWKNSPGCWCEQYEPTDLFSAVFEVDSFCVGKGKKEACNPTLMEALNANGGGIDALARHAVAALLNACSAGVNYPMSVDQVKAAVQAVLPAGDIEGQKNEFAGYNELGCPISADNSANPCQRSDTDGS